MNRKRYVKGVPGRAVDDPDTGRRIGAEPVAVADSPFWRRRIRDGDVVEAADVQPAAAEPEVSPEPQPASSAGRKTKN